MRPVSYAGVPMTIAREFADYCVDLSLEDVDDATVEYTKKLLLDTLGTIVGGYHWSDSADVMVGTAVAPRRFRRRKRDGALDRRAVIALVCSAGKWGAFSQPRLRQPTFRGKPPCRLLGRSRGSGSSGDRRCGR